MCESLHFVRDTFILDNEVPQEDGVVYNASGEMSPSVLASAALYALKTEGVSPPYSDWASMVSSK